MRNHLVLFGTVVAAWLGACGGSVERPNRSGDTGNADRGVASSAAWLLAEAPSGAHGVAEIKPDASEGDSVVIRGRIGGSREPLRPDGAFFTIVDPSVPKCDEMSMDEGCEWPWDYCCEPRELLTANSATVEVVDADGVRMKTNLVDGGLRPGDEVVVVGTVGPRPDAAVLVVRATGIHRVSN